MFLRKCACVTSENYTVCFLYLENFVFFGGEIEKPGFLFIQYLLNAIYVQDTDDQRGKIILEKFMLMVRKVKEWLPKPFAKI